MGMMKNSCQLKASITSNRKIVVTVTIYDAEGRHQNFGQVLNAYVRLTNEESGSEVLRYDLGEDFSIETAVVFCELYRHNGEWKFLCSRFRLPGWTKFALINAYGLQ